MKITQLPAFLDSWVPERNRLDRFAADPKHWRFAIETTWNGEPLPHEHVALVVVSRDGIAIDAPYFDDPPPAQGGGRCDRLWEFEVVEVFLAEGQGADSRYVELELGPHGHWLVLGFEGYRRQTPLPDVVVDYRVRVDREAGRWRGELVLEPSWWQGVLVRSRLGNAFAIHDGASRELGRRRFCAAYPAPTHAERPDFHRVDHFGALPTVTSAV